jgi:MFS family permease
VSGYILAFPGPVSSLSDIPAPLYPLSLVGSLFLVCSPPPPLLTTQIGALVGSLLGSPLSERFGRRTTMLLNSLVFVVGIAIISTSSSLPATLIGRVICGVATGVVSGVATVYNAEISPPHLRGIFGAMFQLMGVTGVLLVYISGTPPHPLV